MSSPGKNEHRGPIGRNLLLLLKDKIRREFFFKLALTRQQRSGVVMTYGVVSVGGSRPPTLSARSRTSYVVSQ